MTAIMNSSFSSNHMNQIAIEEIELAYPGSFKTLIKVLIKKQHR